MARASWWCMFAVLVVSATAQQNFTLEDVVSGNFVQRGFTGRWISDTQFTFTRAGQPGIYVFDVSTLQESVLVSGELMELLDTQNPILSPDGQFILASIDVQPVYRYSTTARYSLYNIATHAIIPVGNGERLELCIFSSGETHALAYVYKNNLFYLPSSTAQAIQITHDGIEGVVYNGHADWVYEEDVMYTGQATWFSTGGSYLAFATYDDTKVESYSYYYYDDKTDKDDPYPELVDLKYPKVGRENPTAILRVVNLVTLVENNQLTYIPIHPPEVVTSDHILGGVIWITDTELAVHWLNRRQNHTVLRICNIVTSVCEEEHRRQPNGWVPIAMPRFSSTGDYFVSLRWSLEQADGSIWQHLYVSMRIGGEVISHSVTPGAFTVNAFIGMDEANVAYYYTRTATGKPWETEVHRAGAGAGCLSCELVLPDGGPCTWATATVSTGGSYMTITCSSPEEPAATFIINPRDGSTLVLWEDNAIVRQRLVGKARWSSLITTVPLENGYPAPVRLLLPPGLNVNDATVKYPVVFYVYSGPNTHTVVNTFTVGSEYTLDTTGYLTAASLTFKPGGSSSLTSAGKSFSRGTVVMRLLQRALLELSSQSIRDGSTLVLWEDNAIVRQRLVGKARWSSLITTVPLENGYPAPVRLLLPPGLNVNDATVKYPVVFYVYSGPNTHRVVNTFTVGYQSYLTTSRNIIYMFADGRGSGLKGQDILYSLNNKLGTVEVDDHFVILRQVLDRYPFMDRTRVGIWGHSYGGYATLLTMLKDDEKLFQCGVSGAPVTSWLYYNTMYTERYMGLPTPEDNLKGYEDGDVTLLAEKLRGHDFFLMHGNADDNVHFQNAAKLMTALQKLDIPFEQMSYPDEAHSLSGVNLHRYNAMDRYWTRCLRLQDWD